MENRKHRILRIVLLPLLALSLILALIYFTGVVFFRTHFPFHTTFLGYDISERDMTAIDECLQREMNARRLTILEMDGEEVLDLASTVDYHRTVSAPANGWIQEDDAWRWPLSLWEARDLSSQEIISYSEKKLIEAVLSLDAMDPANVTPPQNAYLEWQDDVMALVPEVDGNKLYQYRALKVLREAIENDEDTVDLAASDCYQSARIRSDDPILQRTLAHYEAINFQTIDIDLTGETLTLTPDDVLSFYKSYHIYELRLDEDAVASFVQELKDRCDTYEQQRPFVNRYGNEILVGTRADTYGFKMDLDETIALLTATLEGHERHAEIAPVWINSGWTRDENGGDIGDTYIEISISEQYLWAYIDGQMVLSTSVVTGNSGNHDTPRGVFRILYKQQDTTLVGDDYSSPVSFWMPLTWSGVGLHDATWRSSFGGNIYTYSGSHGCVNLPYWAAHDIYWSFSAGTPVVIW